MAAFALLRSRSLSAAATRQPAAFALRSAIFVTAIAATIALSRGLQRDDRVRQGRTMRHVLVALAGKP
jgi:hypothetical protein